MTNLVEIIRLLNTDGIGPVSFYKLLKQHGSVSAALDAVAQRKQLFSQAAAEDEIAKADNLGVKIISYADDIYPENLRQLNDAPPLLYVLGNPALLNYPAAISIVGARNATIGGRKMASHIAYDLTEQDVLVISGMALGIDGAAHKGALYAKHQQGATVAVLGTGVDEIYPPEHRDLYEQIRHQGVIVSEFSLSTKAQISNFPRRNRIIAALSAGTLVVEAGLHSGSLITAKSALEQGKEIFAVPGSPLEARSAGPNQLIKDGAILTENAEDILNTLSITQNRQIKNYQLELSGLDKPQNNVNILVQKKITLQADHFSAPPSAPHTGTKTPLLSLISYEGVDTDELLRSSGLEQADFFMQILDLEFAGKIVRLAGNKIGRVK